MVKGSKLKALFLVLSLIAIQSALARGASLLYRFDGTITGGLGAESNVFVTDHGVEFGVTSVTYIFEVDLMERIGGYTTSHQTVESFQAELIADSYAFLLLGGTSPQSSHASNIYNHGSFHDLAEMVGGTTVAIMTNEDETPAWRLADWLENQTFRFVDGVVPPDGGPAMYLVGHVTLTSIRSVPEPQACAFLLFSSIVLSSVRRRGTPRR